MSNIMDDTIGGYNGFIKEQKEQDGEANVTLVLFDDKYDLVSDGVSINEVEDLDSKICNARGTTALYDAVGKTIATVGGRLSSMDEADRPEKVIFLITTDGYENASHEYDSKRVLEMVKEQEEKYNWEFVFLGANIDSFAAGGNMGYQMKNVANFEANSRGVNTMYAAASMSFSNKRAGTDDMDMADYMNIADKEVDKK
jgi:uncharacterized protein YegL